VTGFDSVSRSYGDGGHLLILNARSADYIPERDNLEERICDYIAPGEAPGPIGDLTISGSYTLKIGGRRTYSADCDAPEWSFDCPDGVEAYVFEDGTLMLEAAFLEDLVGSTVQLSVTDGAETGTLEVEVVA